jgi:proline racemase
MNERIIGVPIGMASDGSGIVCGICRRTLTGVLAMPHDPDCPARAGEPFCMVAFIGSMAAAMASVRNSTLVQSAALRFDRNPCGCAGCRAYADELARRGKGPAALPENVEVKP